MPTPTTPRPLGGLRRVLIGAAALAAAALIGACAAPEPSLVALTSQPDGTLHGTVAYLDPAGTCVRVVAASGARDRQVRCYGHNPADPTLGPQLRWLPDGRLQVTAFRAPSGPGRSMAPGWQELIDVRTGLVQRSDDPPAQPDRSGCPLTSSDGAILTPTTDQRGHAELLLTRPGGRDRIAFSRDLRPGAESSRAGPRTASGPRSTMAGSSCCGRAAATSHVSWPSAVGSRCRACRRGP